MDLNAADRRPRASRARAGFVVFALALVATSVIALAGTGARAPEAGRETTYWLAIESFAGDGDERLDDVDRARFERRFGRRPADVQVVIEGGERRLDAPWLWSRLAASARGALGPMGPAALQVALFAWTALAAVATLTSRLGAGSAAGLVALALFGSAAFAVPFRLEPRALEMASLATAAAAVWYRRIGAATPAGEVYGGDLDGHPSPLRWLIAGIFGTVLVAASPVYLPLLAPLLAAPPAERRGRSMLCFLGGAVVVAAPLLRLAVTPWEALDLVLSPALLGWSTLGLLAGRGVGIVPYFVPALLLLMLGGRGEGRRWVPLAVAGSMAMQLLLAPFDFVEGASAPGNAWFLPALALLLIAAEEGERPRSLLALAVVALPLLAAPWLRALGAAGPAAAVARRVAPFERLLPAASTLRHQPGTIDLAHGGLRVRAFPPGFEGGSDGRLRLTGARADLVATADRPLSSLRLELGASAPARFDVRGGKLGNVIYRPSGEVAADVALDLRGARKHPVWWSREGAWSYPIELRFEAPPDRPVVVDLPFGRLAVPGEGAP